jgi:hypothetical protein
MSASALLACWLTCLRAWPSFRALSPCLGRMSLPLVGFVRLTSLPADLHPRVHSRARRPLGRSVPDDRSRSVFAVSHRPDGFLLTDGAGLLHPAAGRRVRRVSRCFTARSENRSAISRFPRRHSHPPKDPPRQQPCRVTAARALLPSSSTPSAPPVRPRVPITEVTGRFPLRATPRGHDRGAAR